MVDVPATGRGHWPIWLGLLCGVLLLSGCGGSGAPAAHTTPQPTSKSLCANRTLNAGAALPHLAAQTLTVPGAPFAGVAAPDGQALFVSLQNQQGTAGSIAVLARSSSVWNVAHLIALPLVPLGMTLSPDGRTLAVAAASAVYFLNVAAVESGAAGAVVGELATTPDAGTVEVIYSPDGRYLFATDEDTAQVTVFDLRPHGTLEYSPGDRVGNVPVYTMPISMAFSGDGRELYITTWFSGNYPLGNVAASNLGGTLTVVDVARAELNPTDPQAILAQPVVGCGPVRVVLAPDGQTAWISSQWDDTVSAVDLAKLITDPQHAVLATVPVGQAPAGILLVKAGKELLVANTGRYDGTLSPQSVTVIDTQRALDGQPSVLGSIPEGLFPRDFALDGQTVLLTNFASQNVSLIDIATLP